MDKMIACSIVCLLFFAEFGAAQPKTLKSPDGKFELKFTPGNSLNEPLTYELLSATKPIIAGGKIKFNIDEQKLVLKKTKKSKRRGHWKNIYGERQRIPENYNQLQLSFAPGENTGLQLTILLRLYNEGFAYQYLLDGDKEIILKNESSEFGLPENAGSWVSTTAQGILTEKKIRDISNVVERLITIRLNDSVFLALGEAALVDFARMKFTADNKVALITKLDGETKAFAALRSPWRFVLIGRSPADLLQKNYLVLNLNAPNQIKDTKWIQPGKVLREVTLTTKGAYSAIDFASRHNRKYIMFDAGWYGREDHDSSDARRVALDPLRSKGSLDLTDVIRYGNTKGVGVILYVNRRALERQLDTLLPLYQSIGVKGIKFGFV